MVSLSFLFINPWEDKQNKKVAARKRSTGVHTNDFVSLVPGYGVVWYRSGIDPLKTNTVDCCILDCVFVW